jgi:DNA-binding response OmpR family regulator
MLTAKGFELSRQEMHDKYGVIEVISKPFSPRDLLKRVERVLEDAEHPRQEQFS